MNKKLRNFLFMLLFISLVTGCFDGSRSFARAKNYILSASNPRYVSDNVSNVVTKITFKGRKTIVYGKFFLQSISSSAHLSRRMKKITIKIASNCKFYYGEGRISFKSLKRRIRKNGNNCYIIYHVKVKKGKAVEIGLYA